MDQRCDCRPIVIPKRLLTMFYKTGEGASPSSTCVEVCRGDGVNPTTQLCSEAHCVQFSRKKTCVRITRSPEMLFTVRYDIVLLVWTAVSFGEYFVEALVTSTMRYILVRLRLRLR